MRTIPLIIFFLLSGRLVTEAQSHFQISAGYTHTNGYSSNKNHYSTQYYTVKTPFLIDLSFTDSIHKHFGLNYGVQFLHRAVSGLSVEGGNGNETRVQGQASISYLIFELVPEWAWGNRLRFHTQVGLQLSCRVQSYTAIDGFTYGPIFKGLVLSSKDLFRPVILRLPLSMAFSYPIDEKIRIGLKYQLAMDMSRSGNYFADCRNVDQSLLFCVRFYQL